MRNEQKYHFKDFTLTNYRRLLRLAKENYTFRFYSNFDKRENFIIIRHDVDYSPVNALKLALIERDEEIKTTYCFSLHSPFYNCLEQCTTNYIREIMSLGHEIGLHFDPVYYGIKDIAKLNKDLLKEKGVFERMLKCNIKVFSFHNTTPLALRCKYIKYAGMLNAYSGYLREKTLYCSDSNGYWRYRRLEELLTSRESRRLHILLHPVWWQYKVMSPKKKIWQYTDNHAHTNKKEYNKFLKKHKRKNIDW